jgi:putative ABC transport system ATP-binding protein
MSKPQPTGNDIMLRAVGITRVLGEGAGQVHALKGINLSLRAGELTLLMGPSGSGKTTLLSIFGCILQPTKGDLYIVGQTTEGMAAEELADLRRRHIGFIFQSYNLFPTLTAIENVMLALDVRRKHVDDRRATAQKALEGVGLGHRLTAYPRKMSGGERQRVAIARSLVGDPSLILADEPTAALDGVNGKAVMEVLAGIAKDKSRAVFVVTHDSRIVPFADRIVKIEDGNLVSDERPRRPYPFERKS